MSERENRSCLEYVLKYYNIAFTDRQRHGCLNVDCPYCESDEGKHLGIFYDTSKFNFSCLRCKTSGFLFDFLNHLTGISWQDYEELLDSQRPLVEQTALEQIQTIIDGEPEEISKQPRRIQWPPDGTIFIEKMSEDLTVKWFLKSRNIALADCIQREVRIGIMGRWTGRFIFPVYYQNRVVAFQGRDMTGKSEPRYLTQGDVSNYVYNIEGVHPDRFTVITEGVLNAWAVGDNAVATFSAALSSQQIQHMIRAKTPYWIFCWDIASDGSDAFWKGRAAVQYLSSILGAGRVGYVELPPGQDAASLGREKIWQILKYPKFL